jgi:SAM-dependent methyltransferase
MDDYRQINRRLWNERTAAHLTTDFYDMAAFRAGASSLKPPELAAVGPVEGQSLLHLQCHFGQDSLSWARLGAQVTGVDLSDVAIETARRLAQELALPAQFLACDLYEVPQQLPTQFDVVVSTYGTIGWLPDLDRWAAVVAQALKPNGRLVLVEFHPVLWMFDDAFTHFAYSYFNTGPIITQTPGSYAAPGLDSTHSQEIGWNHSLAEVIGALHRQGLSLDWFEEYPYSVWNCFPDMQLVGDEQWVVKGLGAKMPHMYGLRATWRS